MILQAIFLMFYIFLGKTFANDNETFQEGQNWARGLVKEKPQKNFLQKNGFNTTGNEAQEKSDIRELSNTLIETGNKYSFDYGKNDPMFALADEIVENPELALNGDVVIEDAGPSDERTCIEPAKPFQATCREKLVLDKTKYEEEKEIKHKRWVPPVTTTRKPEGRYHSKFSYSTGKMTVTTYTLKEGYNEEYSEKIPEKIEFPEVTWESDCTDLQKLVKDGFCRVANRTCLDNLPRQLVLSENVSREINPPGGCWVYETTFACADKIKGNTCKVLRKQSCTQTNSEPNERLGQYVLSYKQTMECNPARSKLKKGEKGKPFFCADGGCTKMEWEPNEDMEEAFTQIALLAATAGQFDEKSVSLFKGNHNTCRKAMAGFRSCCGKGKGWGGKIGFGCKEDEKKLALLRDEKKCHEVGSFCAQKVLGKCIEWRKSFCCFPLELSAFIQIEGHKLLGKSWGTPKHPHCGGLTIEEFSRAMPKIDLGPHLNKIMQNRKDLNVKKTVNDMKNNMMDRMPRTKNPEELNKYRGKSEQ